MSSAERQIIPWSHLEQLRHAKQILQQEAGAIEQLAAMLDADFCAVVELLWECTGSVIVTGMGKAGLIGQKLVATLSSTGTAAHFLHPAEAVHGDLGCLREGDVLLALSNSGETEEVVRILPIVAQLSVPVVAMTSSRENTLACAADYLLCVGKHREADALGLAPSTSTTVMLAMGDALALVVSRLKGFTPRQFATFHPGGSLGQKLSTVRDTMRKGDQLRLAAETSTIREVFLSLKSPARRTGAVMLLDEAGTLTGLFTDSDLARLLEQRREFQLDQPISEVMTRNPLTISAEATLSDVVDVMSKRKVSELPVVDADHHPLGLIDITDVIGLMPPETID